MNEVKDLGTTNGWGPKRPPEYIQHIESMKNGEEHDTKVVQRGRCWHEVTCHTCGIRWDVDSGD
jgi:hypothetical protein